MNIKQDYVCSFDSFEIDQGDNEFDIDPVTLNKLYIAIDHHIKAIESSLTNDINIIPSSALLVTAEIYPLLKDKDKWDKIIFELMTNLRNYLYNYIRSDLYLFGGFTEIGLVLSILNKNTTYYGKFLNTINNLIGDEIDNYISKIDSEFDELKMSHYDTVLGASGILYYLINYTDNNDFKDQIEILIKYLVKISLTIDKNGYNIPAWYIKHENHVKGYSTRRLLNGSFNSGLSHGIAGPLVAISKAKLNGFSTSEIDNAIDNIINYYKMFILIDDNNLPCWNSLLSFEEYINKKPDINNISNRMSWCYGSIGILVALQIASEATNDTNLYDFTNESLIGIGNLDKRKYNLISPTLCHGYSGILSIFSSLYKKTKNTSYKLFTNNLLEIVLKYYDKNSIYGFYDFEFVKHDKNKMESTDTNDFLVGSAGVVLSLISLIKSNTDFEKHMLII